MANHKSAIKRQRRDAKRRVVNLNRLNRVRTFIKNVKKAVENKDKAAATEMFNKAQPEIMRAAAKGVLAKNAASRQISRMNARIKAL